MNLLCFKLNRVCLDLLIMSNAGDFSSGVEFLRILSRFKNGNENSGSSFHVLHKTPHFEVAPRSRAVGMVGHLCSRNDCKYTWEKTARISCHNFETNGRPYSGRQRNLLKSVMHVESCCFAHKINCFLKLSLW